MNKYTQPVHKGISTVRERKKNRKPENKRRKYLREPIYNVRLTLMDEEIDPYWFKHLTMTALHMPTWVFTATATILKDRDSTVKNPFKST